MIVDMYRFFFSSENYCCNGTISTSKRIKQALCSSLCCKRQRPKSKQNRNHDVEQGTFLLDDNRYITGPN